MNPKILKKDISFPPWLLRDPNYIYTTNDKSYLVIYPRLKD